MKTFVASVGQKPLWEGSLPPVSEGMRIIVGRPGSQVWMVDRAFIYLSGKTPHQTVYVRESSTHERAPWSAR